MRVLVTRAEKEGRATAARLAELGHEALLEPLTTIEPVAEPAFPPFDELQAVTATSLNAVEVLAGRPEIEALGALPFYAVGGRTARAARDVGFTEVRSAEGDRRDLTAAIRAGLDPAKGAILWLVGRDRAGDLVADLAPDGFRVIPVETYGAVPVARLGEATIAALAEGDIDAALVFSPRSGAILLEKLAEAGFSPTSFTFPVHVISEAAARPFREAGWREIVVAGSPDTEAVLAGLAPPPAAAEAETRSSPMPSKPRKDARAATETEADAPVGGDTEAVTEATAPSEPDDTAAPLAAEPAAETVTKPLPEPEPPLRPVAAPPPPRRGFGIGGVLVATLLGGALGVGGTWGLAFQGLLPGRDGGDGRLAALETAVGALKTQKPAADPATVDRLGALEKRLANLPVPAPVADPASAERLAAVEKRLAALAATPAPAAAAMPAVDPAIADRLAKLEQRLDGAPAPMAAPVAAPVDLSAVEARIARLEGAVKPTVDLSGVEGRLARLEAAPKPTVDLSGLEDRLARLEAVPPLRLPVDLADRVAGLEAAAKSRAEAAQTSVVGALSGIAAEGASKQALAEMAGQVDRALGSLRESAGAEIAALKARVERLGGGIDAESRAMVERSGAEAKTLAARLAMETQAVADRLAAQTATTVEDLRRRNDDLARALDQHVATLLAASDAEGRKRLEDLGRSLSEKSAALSTALEAEVKRRSEETAAALQKLRGDLDQTLGRVGSLETATRDVGSAGQKMVEKVGEAAAAAETRVGALESRLTGIEAEAEAARRAQADALVVIALADLKSAVEAGRPYAAELAVVDGAAKGGIDLAPLAPFAAKGVPTVATLSAGWAKVARAAIAAGDPAPAGGNALDRLWSHATGVVKVRQPGEAGGNDAAALVARLETRLTAGDLPGALAVWKSLPEAARKASADWGAALEGRVTVDTALAARTAAVVARLTGQK